MENQQEQIVDTEIISTENHSSKYGSQLTVVAKDFATLFEGSDMKKHLSSLKRKYSGLKIKDVNDTETYEEIKKAISVVRPLRTAMDKKRKEVNKEAKSFIDSVNDMGAKIQAEIAKIEDPLWIEREKFEALQKEESERIEREAKEKLDARVNELRENGLVFNGSLYAINDVNVSIQFIQELPDEEYTIFLAKVKSENEKNIAEQKRKEEEAKAEADRQEAIRLENERVAAELRKQQEELAEKLKAIADKEAEIARQEQAQKELEEKQAREKKEREESETIANNAKKYEELGYKFSYSNKVWTIQIGTYFHTISRADMLLDESGKYEMALESAQVATQKENERLQKEEEERQAKAKADAEEAERKRLELLSETEVFNEWLGKLKAIAEEYPVLTDTQLQNKIYNIRKAINQ